MPVAAVFRKLSRRVRFPKNKKLATRTKLATRKQFDSQNCSLGQGSVQELSGASYNQDKSPKIGIKMTTRDQETVEFGIPPVFKELPVIRDLLVTESSRVQDETVESCLHLLAGTDYSLQTAGVNRFGIPRLLKNDHLEYLYDSLGDYPAGFVGIDASRPWMLYWALAGLAVLGEDLTGYRERVVSTLMPMHNVSGGFGGGHGQTSHCAPTFAAVLSLALVGGNEVFRIVDRKAMWRWIGELKQPDGGFQVAAGGEEDLRGAYCAIVIVSLLDLPLELPPESAARQHGLTKLTSGLEEYLSRCQTYEGGVSQEPSNEAHGSYTFCALACLSILGRPEDTISKCLDVPSLLSWLSARQYAPEGGFSGRTNKLVDACYSHWVGGCWPLIQSSLYGSQPVSEPLEEPKASLYSREGLARYILGCCQVKSGGLRDKPGKHPDSYHTCYALVGLSNLQYYHYHCDVGNDSNIGGAFASSFSWKSIPIEPKSDDDREQAFQEIGRLTPFHPIYGVPHQAAKNLREWSEGQESW